MKRAAARFAMSSAIKRRLGLYAFMPILPELALVAFFSGSARDVNF
jgi:hypothetical protein